MRQCTATQRSVSCSSWKSVCHEWTATDATHNCMPCCEYILAVRASWFIPVCGFCLCGIRSWKSHVWWFLRVKETLNLLLRWWVGRTGPIPCSGKSCDFTILEDIFWDCHRTYGILLMQGHTEIKHVLRSALFWDCTQHKMVIPFQCLGITNRSHPQGSRCPRRTCLDSRQPAHSSCL